MKRIGKILLLLAFLLFSFSWAQKSICLVPNNIKDKISPLFSGLNEYSDINVILKGVPFENTLLEFSQSSNIQFAIVRRDILWQLQKHKKYAQIDHFFILSQLPYKAQLFFLTNDQTSDISLFKNKIISVGNINDENSFYLKSLLELYNLKHAIFYKSYSYTKSLNALEKNVIDGYFTFLPDIIPIDNAFHTHTSFAKKIIRYFEDLEIFEIDYKGIFTPYMLVASVNASDEEIETMIYTLMKENLFAPMTDKRFGAIDHYLMRHIESVKSALQKTVRSEKIETTDISQTCREYHYGFLKLLRLKPKLKKKLKYFQSIEKDFYLKQINKILISIDQHKEACDLGYLEKKRKQFLSITEMIQKVIN